jgi:hypothetical protein
LFKSRPEKVISGSFADPPSDDGSCVDGSNAERFALVKVKQKLSHLSDDHRLFCGELGPIGIGRQ